MIDYLVSGGFAVFLWWFSTGLVLYLIGLPGHTFPRILAVATGLLPLALAGLVWSGARETVFAAYLSFACGMAIYAWQELSYYLGFITGPRKVACEPGCRGWRHFGHAIEANLYHEIATIAGGAVVLLLCWDSPNRVGMWTYLVLWAMQLSAKLNVFLGVRNLSEEFLPAHMQHLRVFLKKKPMNLLFPFSIVIGTALAVWLAQSALAAEPGGFAATGWALLAFLVALAVLEHWMLILPLSASAPWQWWLDRRRGAALTVDSGGAVDNGGGIAESACLVRGREH
ncbi:MAG: putative photosynthetic complex assembly protein PuhE [Gammaproteobacteria bacterium]|nr:putative photosynthetic complex assembly protein PuhE [Gammaproteobacteria bacterium]MCY4182208.1 putative photosynthetic complex assembly protein PuhE [Gammaproteobacteria bacterium]